MKKCFCQIATILGLLAPLAGLAQSARLTSTLTNLWGVGSIAMVGNDRLLIGAPSDDTSVNPVGAYLYSTNGALLTMFTNQPGGYYFGYAVAALGIDRVLIGSYADYQPGDGAVFVFSTNGTLICAITNPNPAISYFGFSIAAVGTDRILIGACGAIGSGIAYLYDTNGLLITTLANPTATPDDDDSFGCSVAALGTDRVLIGAMSESTSAPGAGAAYLFNTNGALLASFTNTMPAVNDFLGWSMAAVGNDRVLIGAFGESRRAPFAGAAYLFDTNGALLTTFTNSVPKAGDAFGVSVTAVGDDRVLIGAYSDDAGATNAGAAYLFSTNGTLLTVITNPTPRGGDFYGERFGNSVVALANDRVLIGTPRENTGEMFVGTVHLFSLEPFTPGLSVTHAGGNVIVSWSKTAEGFVLERTTAFPPTPPGNSGWEVIPFADYQTNATSIFISQSNPIRYRFFRLRKP